MTPERLAEIRALLAAATPGPWEASPYQPTKEDKPHCAWRIFFRGHDNPMTNTRDCYLGRQDAAFIAAAPTVIDELLAEVEMLTYEKELFQAAWEDICTLVEWTEVKEEGEKVNP